MTTTKTGPVCDGASPSSSRAQAGAVATKGRVRPVSTAVVMRTKRALTGPSAGRYGLAIGHVIGPGQRARHLGCHRRGHDLLQQQRMPLPVGHRDPPAWVLVDGSRQVGLA